MYSISRIKLYNIILAVKMEDDENKITRVLFNTCVCTVKGTQINISIDNNLTLIDKSAESIFFNPNMNLVRGLSINLRSEML